MGEDEGATEGSLGSDVQCEATRLNLPTACPDCYVVWHMPAA